MFLFTSAVLSRFEQAAEGNFELGLAPMPSFGDKPTAPHQLGLGHLHVFPEDPVKQRAAWELMKFLTSQQRPTRPSPPDRLPAAFVKRRRSRVSSTSRAGSRKTRISKANNRGSSTGSPRTLPSPARTNRQAREHDEGSHDRGRDSAMAILMKCCGAAQELAQPLDAVRPVDPSAPGPKRPGAHLI